MPHYAYRARDPQGQAVSGTLEAADIDAAAAQLSAKGLIPVHLAPGKEKTSTKKQDGAGFNLADLMKPPVTHEDRLMFSRQMHTLLKAGLPIIRALSGLQESAVNPSMKEIIRDIRENLEGGRELSLALARHPKVFSTFYLSMVRVGEATGMLDTIFLRLYEHLEFEQFMREQVKSALRYPMFVIIAMAIAIVVINILVIPAFANVFKGFGAELPLMTKILLGFSAFMLGWWPFLLGGLSVAIALFLQWKKTPAGRYQWEAMLLHFPIAGKIIKQAALARFARSYALGSRSGVPIMHSLANAAQTVDNLYISGRIDGMRNNVERGESVLRAAIAANFFTPLILQMIAVGEESGTLDEMMDEIGTMYQREVEYQLKTLGQQIEPILLLALGAMVLVLALGVFLPMWDMGKVAMKQ